MTDTIRISRLDNVDALLELAEHQWELELAYLRDHKISAKLKAAAEELKRTRGAELLDVEDLEARNEELEAEVNELRHDLERIEEDRIYAVGRIHDLIPTEVPYA